MINVFLMTDVVGSTQMWERFGESMPGVLARHDELVHGAVRSAGGSVFKHTGDGMIAVFDEADSALAAARAAIDRLGTEHWGPVGELHIRAAIHSGTSTGRDGDYFGPALNRLARIAAVTHPDQIVLSDIARQLLSEPKGTDLGLHRLRDLGEPLRLWQLDDGDHPPLPTVGQANNLPVQLTEFIGRATEAAQLDDLLQRHQLVSVTGVGGCGKTRLALEVGATVIDRYPGGVWFIDLRNVDNEDRIASEMAAAIGLLGSTDIKSPADVEDLIVEFADRQPTMLVVDNCEHVIDGAADLIESLLQRVAGLTILATSREALGVEGERVWRIPSLSSDSGEATELFVARALAVDADFRTGPDELALIGDVCARLDGIPLAIELAAARVTHLSLAELNDRLDERFLLLSGGRRARRQRQQTLQAMMDWSWELLDDDERQLLADVSVFRGGFDRPAMEQVCRPTTARTFDVVSGLVDRSLVKVSTSTLTGASRYDLLETVRLYGLDRLTEHGAIADLRDRHSEWARRINSCLTVDFLDDSATLYAHENVDNILAAVDRLLDTGNIGDAAEIASARPWHFNFERNLDGQRLFTDDLLGHPDVATPVRLAAITTAAVVFVMAADYERVARLAGDGCALAEQLLADPTTDGTEADQNRMWGAVIYALKANVDFDRDGGAAALARARELWPEGSRRASAIVSALAVHANAARDYHEMEAVTAAFREPTVAHIRSGHAVSVMLRTVALVHLGRVSEAARLARLLLEAGSVRGANPAGSTMIALALAADGDVQEALDLVRHPSNAAVGNAVGQWRLGRLVVLARIVRPHDPLLAARLLGAAPETRAITLQIEGRHDRNELRAQLGDDVAEAAFAEGATLGEEAVIGAASAVLVAHGLTV